MIRKFTTQMRGFTARRALAKQAEEGILLPKWGFTSQMGGLLPKWGFTARRAGGG